MKANVVWKILPFLLIVVLIFLLLFYPKKGEASEDRKIVEVWNVDTFEGGKGSRTTFLNRIAKDLEREDGSVIYLVRSFSIEGAEASLSGGNVPDIISYGIGLPEVSSFALPLPYSFAGAERGDCLAVPWCRGKYYLFSLSDFDEEGKTAISCGGQNVPVVAAALENIQGEELSSSEAYTSFLSGKYRYLLGTQRDVCRFETRNVEVNRRELPLFCDLFQCVSILKKDKFDLSLRLVEKLCSEETRECLSDIGMEAPSSDGVFSLDLFSGREELASVRDLARGEEPRKNLDKFLKTI